MNRVLEEKEILWRIFAEYWDDESIIGARNHVVIDARTVRVLKSVLGSKLVTKCLQQWEQEGSVKLLGNPDDLNPEVPCVQIKGYVSNILEDVSET